MSKWYEKVGPRGKAIGIDHIPELVNMSVENIKRDQPHLIESNRVKLIGWLELIVCFVLRVAFN